MLDSRYLDAPSVEQHFPLAPSYNNNQALNYQFQIYPKSYRPVLRSTIARLRPKRYTRFTVK